MPAWDPNKIAADLQWLKDHPWFHEKPASIVEFLGPDYLNIEKGIRPGVKQELVELFGAEVNGNRIARYRWGMFTGAIGIGKTTMASVILPYMVHWVLCLKDPQEFFNLLPGSRIAFMMMSTSEDQAKETVFGDVKARIQYSPWFRDNFPYDPDFKNQIRFDKDIWILPGSSMETSFEGYNILGGILDEADSHKITQNKDYGEDGWNTINGRIDSRFQDRGFLLTVGQMKKANGFAARKYKELNEDPQNAHTVRMTIWESLGWNFSKYLNPDGTRNSFWYDSKRKEIVTKEAAQILGFPEHIMEIPRVYEKNFRNKPEQALRDLAGIPPQAGSAFISLVHRVEECFERWVERNGEEQPVGPDARRPVLAEWFRSPTPLRRAVHLDIGYSGNGDAAGIVMGHVSHLVKTKEDDDEKPYIVIDCIIRVKAAPGQEVLISDLRNYIYDLKRRGFRIQTVTMDGFQCFTGDTMIPLLDGRTLSISDIAEKYPDGGVWTYSYDGNKIVPGKVTKAWKTSRKNVIRVGLDNGEVIRCTPDHRFMLRNGEYKEASLLDEGDSLMPLYRRIVTEGTGHMDGYEQVAQPRESTTRWQYTHRMVAGDIPEGYVKYKNYDASRFEKYLFTVCKALQYKIDELETQIKKES